MKGRFLVFEGIDGCGKTTQLTEITKWLPNSGLMPEGSELQITREPGGTALGNSLRELLLHPPKEVSPKPLTELLLYASDRAQHISEVIIPAIERGDWVISDRFSGSTLSYQGYGRGLSLNLIRELEAIATQGVVPDLTFWLDLSVQESLARRSAKNHDRIESEGADFLSKVAYGFQYLAKERNWVRIPAKLQKDLVTKKIQDAMVKNLLNKRKVLND